LSGLGGEIISVGIQVSARAGRSLLFGGAQKSL
jgi:hypothetical protein